MTDRAGNRRARARQALFSLAPGGGTVPRAPGDAPLRSVRPEPHVLLVRPDHLGDVLFVGPALSRLRTAWPDAHITLLVGPWSEQIARRLPGADAARTLTFPWFDRQPKGAPWRPYARLLRAARDLRRAEPPFDIAVLLRDDDYWSAWLTRLAGIPVRIGHDTPAVRPFASHVLPAELRPTHTAGANIALVNAVVGSDAERPSPEADPLALVLRDEDRTRAASLLGAVGAEARFGGLVAVHPGSGAAIKRWRPGAWSEVLTGLTAPDETIVLTGGHDERTLTASVAARLGRDTLDLAGRTDLGSLAAVFARCRLVMGPDSGPLHLAVAVGTPTVHLFGPADAARFGPWGPPARHRVVAARLPCAPCGRLDWPADRDHPCVRTLSVADVSAAAGSCCPPWQDL